MNHCPTYFLNLLLIITLSLTFMYRLRLFKRVRFISRHGVTVKNVFLVGLIGSLINWGVILFIGYCWALSFIYLIFDQRFYSIELMTLWLFPLFCLFFSLSNLLPLNSEIKSTVKISKYLDFKAQINFYPWFHYCNFFLAGVYFFDF